MMIEYLFFYCPIVSKSLLIVLGTLPKRAVLGYGKCRPVENTFSTGLGQPFGLTTLPTAPTATTTALSYLFLTTFANEQRGFSTTPWGGVVEPSPACCFSCKISGAGLLYDAPHVRPRSKPLPLESTCDKIRTKILVARKGWS